MKSLKKYVCILLVLALFVILCISINNRYKIINNDIEFISVTKIDNCDKNVDLYYSTDNRKYYTSCLKDITIKYKNKVVPLSKELSKNTKIMNKVLDNLKSIEMFNDGGTEIYKNDTLTVIKCNRLTDDSFDIDYYFGDENMQYDENFCSNN